MATPHALEVGGRLVPLDQDDHLCRLDDWSREVAHALAHRDDITLGPTHWLVIDAARAFYRDYRLVPANRPLVRYLRERSGREIGSSRSLMTLFPGRQSPARIVARIAGLPRPPNCD